MWNVLITKWKHQIIERAFMEARKRSRLNAFQKIGKLFLMHFWHVNLRTFYEVAFTTHKACKLKDHELDDGSFYITWKKRWTRLRSMNFQVIGNLNDNINLTYSWLRINDSKFFDGIMFMLCEIFFKYTCSQSNNVYFCT